MKKWIIIVLLFWVLFYAVNNAIWLNKSVGYPIEPESTKYIRLMRWQEALKGDLHGIKVLVEESYLLEQVYFIPGAVLSNLFNVKYRAHIMINLIYFLLFIIGVYLLGNHFGGKSCGLIAVSLISLYPIIYGLSRKFFTDFGVLWLIAFAVYFILKTECFRNTKYSILFGLTVGLGLIIRKTSPLYISGPVIVVILYTILSLNKSNVKTIAKNMSLSLLMILLVAGYRYTRPMVLKHHLTEFFAGSSLDLTVFSKDIVDWGLSLPFTILFAAGLIYLFRYYKIKNNRTILAAGFFVPYILHTFMPHGNVPRYTAGLILYPAIISALFLSSLKKKRYLIPVFLFVGFVQYFDLSYDLGLKMNKLRFNNEIRFEDNVHPPVPEDQDLMNMFTSVIRNISPGNEPKVLLFVQPRTKLSYVSSRFQWDCYKWLNGLPFEMRLVQMDFIYIRNLIGYIKEYDIILYEGADIKEYSELKSFITAMFDIRLEYVKYHNFYLKGQDERITNILEGDNTGVLDGYTIDELTKEIYGLLKDYEKKDKFLFKGTNIYKKEYSAGVMVNVYKRRES